MVSGELNRTASFFEVALADEGGSACLDWVSEKEGPLLTGDGELGGREDAYDAVIDAGGDESARDPPLVTSRFVVGVVGTVGEGLASGAAGWDGVLKP